MIHVDYDAFNEAGPRWIIDDFEARMPKGHVIQQMQWGRDPVHVPVPSTKASSELVMLLAVLVRVHDFDLVAEPYVSHGRRKSLGPDAIKAEMASCRFVRLSLVPLNWHTLVLPDERLQGANDWRCFWITHRETLSTIADDIGALLDDKVRANPKIEGALEFLYEVARGVPVPRRHSTHLPPALSIWETKHLIDWLEDPSRPPAAERFEGGQARRIAIRIEHAIEGART